MSKHNRDNVSFQKPRELHTVPIPSAQPSAVKRKQYEAERKKLMNIMYHGGQYFIQEPWPDKVVKRDPDVIIEKHMWIVLRYLPQMRTEIGLNDVVRFGRLSFRVTEFVITKEQIAQTKVMLNQLKDGIFQMQPRNLPTH